MKPLLLAASLLSVPVPAAAARPMTIQDLLGAVRVSDPQLSPDGKQAPDAPVAVHHLTRLLYRHWDEWRGNVRHHVFVASLAGGDPRDLTPGDFDSPPTQAEDAAIAFSPDSREVVFVSNREGADREAWSTNSDVWSVPVTGGTAKKLTPNPAADAQPVFTPHGQLLIVRAQRPP